MEKLHIWLQNELKRRNWAARELARKAKINHQSVNRGLDPNDTIGPTVARKIATALNTPVESVFRMAGILPPNPKKDEHLLLIEHIYENLPEEKQTELTEYARFLREKVSDKTQVRTNVTTETEKQGT